MNIQNLNVIIPLGGLGQRFLDTGFMLPKPLINLMLKPIIFWLLDLLSLSPHDNLILICNKNLRQFRFADLIKKKYHNAKVVYLDKDTKGAAETVLLGMPHADPSFPVILLDGDTFYNVDILGMYRKSKNKNLVFCFNQSDAKPIYSYIKVDGSSITDIAEKKQISNIANTGAYCFSSVKVFKKYCEKQLESFSTKENAELYTSSIIKNMIKDGINFDHKILKEDDFEVVGTPLQYKIFLNEHKENSKHFKGYRICFDFDNTLVTYPDVDGDYLTVRPIQENIDYAKFLHDLGCTIIIYTARRMKTHNGNIGSVVADIGNTTIDTIKKYNIPCDELYFGKPYAHAYIDALAYNALDNYQIKLGITNDHVQERDFNQVSIKTLEVFEKKSKKLKKIAGEVYWYENMPKNIQDYIPKLISKNLDDGSYILEKINGVTFSELLISQSLSESSLVSLLDIMSEIHSCSITEDISDEELYSNYSEKLISRYESYDYSKFPNSELVYKNLLEKLKTYQNNSLAIAGCIHGDPVFSNALIDKNNQIKLVDPRGILNNKSSIYGDIFYDYAKILQSLSGYDEIMLCGRLRTNNSKFINIFNERILSTYGEKALININNIKDSLLFTLLPLHDNHNCVKYYSLINTTNINTNSNNLIQGINLV